MYFRFATARVDPVSKQPLGIFVAAGDLLREGVDPWAKELIEERLDWYNAELPIPPPERFRGGKAVCWFKPDAGPMIQRLWPVARAMSHCGLPVRVIRRNHPGRIRYQDRWQVVVV